MRVDCLFTSNEVYGLNSEVGRKPEEGHNSPVKRAGASVSKTVKWIFEPHDGSV